MELRRSKTVTPVGSVLSFMATENNEESYEAWTIYWALAQQILSHMVRGNHKHYRTAPNDAHTIALLVSKLSNCVV